MQYTIWSGLAYLIEFIGFLLLFLLGLFIAYGRGPYQGDYYN
jgi:hypothetical protein